MPRGAVEAVKLDAVRLRLLERASRAPSGHNTQPWVVHVREPDRWTLRRDPERRLPAVDGDDRELVLSLGAFLESLVVAAAAEGFSADVNPLDASRWGDDIAEIALAPRGALEPAAAAELERRRTLRGAFETRDLLTGDVEALAVAAGERVAYHASGTSHGRLLREATVAANRTQAFRDDAQRELVAWIRWTRDDAARRRDGLSLAALDVTGLKGWFAETFLSSQRLLSRSSRRSQVDSVAATTAACGGWLVLTSADASRASLIEAGRRLQRLWLAARSRHVALQPMSQALEESPWRDELGRQLGVGSDEVQFLLRVGYVASYPPPVSLRRPVASFLVSP